MELLDRYFSIKTKRMILQPLTHVFQTLQKENVKDFLEFLKQNPEIKENLFTI